MMTVSAVARLIPSPPARVDSKKQNAGEPTATSNINTKPLGETVPRYNKTQKVCICIALRGNLS